MTTDSRQPAVAPDAHTRPDPLANDASPTSQEDGPVAVIELFTSEGCSSCPPADELLSDIVHEATVGILPLFALAFHVDYWDFQGWPDRFASAEHSARQRSYAAALGTGTLYTPQMIVNGAVELVGSRRSTAWSEITAALGRTTETAMSLAVARPAPRESEVVVTYDVKAPPDGGVINVAVVERGLVVDVQRGENAGRTLHHDNVVRAFRSLPLEAGTGRTQLRLPPALDPARSSVIAYVQLANTGPIVTAAGVEVAPAAS